MSAIDLPGHENFFRANWLMNYFAHAFYFLDKAVNPSFLGGLAVPDWLNVVNRKIKARSKAAQSFLESRSSLDTPFSQFDQELARGIIQHHRDDQWFHESPVFNRLCLEFAVELRDLLAPDAGFRPSFLGHILVELLLDDCLIQRYPEKIERYYAILDELDPVRTQQTVSQIAGTEAERLDWLIGKFREIRFLYDYSTNEKLLTRLNQVMQRVKLLPLPKSLFGFFDSARQRVSDHIDPLYFEPQTQSTMIKSKDQT